MKVTLVCIILALNSILLAVDVGGHITQDTTWSPENNPYIVTAFIYVDTGVTLTIQPGVQILVGSADCDTNWQGIHWNGGSEPTMKMFIVYGKIVAVGTHENNIVFDHYPDNPTWMWGGICFMPGAPHSIFEYCQINNTLLTYQAPSTVSEGALHIRNGGIRLRHSSIRNYRIAINGEYLDDSLLLYDCDFSLEQVLQYGYNPFTFAGEVFAPDKTMSIYACSFTNFRHGGVFIGYRYYELILSKFLNSNPILFNSNQRNSRTYNAYGNTLIYEGLIDGTPGFGAYTFENADTAYCRRNTIIANCPDYPPFCAFYADGDGGSLIIADNYGYGKVAVDSPISSLIDVRIYNNILHTSHLGPLLTYAINDEIYAPAKIFNNVFHSIRGWGLLLSHNYQELPNISYNNNTFISNSDGIFGNSISTYTNNVIAPAESVYYDWFYNETEHEIFYNNCLSSALPDSILDGGGNIIATPIFADTLALDYHLQADSPCINAGIVTANMPEFDADYHLRGSTPDIGAYEYGSVYIGGIQGYVYDSQTGQALDCTKIMIDGKLPEFSDSLGTFSYPTGTGIYTVTVRRFDYQDLIIPNVVVNLGDTISLNIPMQLSPTESEDDVVPAVDECLVIYSRPNPFRIETDITFILDKKGLTKVSIYNIKGQKISVLSDGYLDKGFNSFKWNGKDSSEKQCSAGVYIVRVEQAMEVKSHKITLIK